MANWKEPKIDYKAEDQVTPSIFNTLGENERYLQEVKITTEQVQNAVVASVEASIRENLSDNEVIKTAFGKIRKLFSDLKSLAFADKVAASNVTGLSKVATSGDYNDLTNKPSNNGITLTKYEFNTNTSYPAMEGIFLCFVRFKNRASIKGLAALGTICLAKWEEAGDFSGVSSVYESDHIKIMVSASVGESTMRFSVYESKEGNGDYAPNDTGQSDCSYQIILYKIGDLPPIDGEWNESII